MAVASKYRGKPVAFIAVNSGNSPAEVASYLRKNKVAWPAIVDPNRIFESASDVGQISLQNIWQFRGIDAEGELRGVNSSDLEASIDRLVAGAAWNVDPESIPESLQKSWFAVEFGNFAAAARDLKKALASNKTEIKTGAEKLHGYVMEQMEKELSAADTFSQNEDHWQAYKAYSQAKEMYDGYQMEVDLSKLLKELASNEKVKVEVAALKSLESVRKKKVNSKSAYARAVAALKKIIDQYPNTEASATARELLESQSE